MEEFFETIGQVLENIWEFIVDLVKGLIDALKILLESVDQLTKATNYLPDFLKTYALITISIIFILFIINRTGGKNNE